MPPARARRKTIPPIERLSITTLKGILQRPLLVAADPAQAVKLYSLLFALLATFCGQAHAAEPAKHLNIVFITADDLNFDSLGCYGCPIADITPHLDRLAGEGMRFDRAYSTVAVCQPVRQTMLTGLYPHRSGSMGFFPIKPGVRTLNQQMRESDYLMAMLGKSSHYQPRSQFVLDLEVSGISRDPAKLAEATRQFIGMAREQNKPFLHFVNCTDPHRPFITGPDDLADGAPPSRYIREEEVRNVPGFLEDLPDIRRELAQYFTNVRRLDDCVGAVLGVLDEMGLRDDTLVLFYGGDHGMAFPFAKTNCYEDSSRGCLIVRWPGRVAAGKVDARHFVSTLDFTPTLMDAAQVPPIPGMDGRSFLPLLEGGGQDGRDHLVTFYNSSSGRNWLPMRCLRTPTRSYIWNAWSDGKMKYSAENMSGLTWQAMLAAAATDPQIQARTDFYLHRVPEEFYDLTGDRCERVNLIADPVRQTEVEAARAQLLAELRRIGDPMAEAFARRDDPVFVAAEKAKLAAEYNNSNPPRKGADAAAAHEAAPPSSAPPSLAFELPAALVAGQPAFLKIRHKLPGTQKITVTLKSGNQRIDRQTIDAVGAGTAEVRFTIPVGQSGQRITFNAFLGTDFQSTAEFITSQPQSVK